MTGKPEAAGKARVDTIVVHYGDPTPTLRLAEQLGRELGGPVWIIDNSGNLTIEAPAGCTILHPDRNLGFGSGVNYAAAVGQADLLLILNPDVIIAADDIDVLRASLESDHRLAAVAPVLAYPDGQPQLNGGSFSGWAVELVRATGYGHLLRGVRGRLRALNERPHAGDEATAQNLIRRDWVSGAALLIKRNAFDAVGGFDERFFMYFEDEDLCRRLRRIGFEVAVVNSVRATHEVGGAEGGRGPYRHPAHAESRVRFHAVHSGPLLRSFVRATARRSDRAE